MATIQERGKLCMSKKVENEAYQKIKTKINEMDPRDDNRNKLLAAVAYYYDNAEKELNWDKMSYKITKMDFSQLKSVTLELSGEGINRDMIEYVRTGTRGKLASTMYDKLK